MINNYSILLKRKAKRGYASEKKELLNKYDVAVGALRILEIYDYQNEHIELEDEIYQIESKLNVILH